MKRAVIFDNDGVLIDSEPMHLEADLRTLAAYGVEWDASRLHRFIGVKDIDMWRTLAQELQLPEPPDELLRHKLSYQEQVFVPERIRPIPGIPELFLSLRAAGWGIGVASSSMGTLIRPWLRHMGLLDQLDVLVTGEHVSNSKPHPEPYLLAARRLGLPPANCVAVEDSPHGLESARAAGCFCIGYRGQNGPFQDLSAADVVVTDMRDILHLDLLKLNGSKA